MNYFNYKRNFGINNYYTVLSSETPKRFNSIHLKLISIYINDPLPCYVFSVLRAISGLC